MKESKTKKELKTQYNERKITGGVFVIRNKLTNKLLLGSSTDLQGSKNRFEFAQSTGSCVDMKLQKDWAKHGGGEFVFESLEELVKSEAQTTTEFAADIKILEELWLEKLDKDKKELY